jgi:hypothetical protein
VLLGPVIQRGPLTSSDVVRILQQVGGLNFSVLVVHQFPGVLEAIVVDSFPKTILQNVTGLAITARTLLTGFLSVDVAKQVELPT